MTQNLRIHNKTINSTDSNIISGTYYIPTSNSNWNRHADTSEVYIHDSNEIPNEYVAYNYYTATAGSGSQKMSNGDASSSICPKNWYLPTQVSYTNLLSKYDYSWSAFFNSPLNFNKSGYVYYSSNITHASYYINGGWFWSSTSYSAAPTYGSSDGYAYYFDIRSQNTNPSVNSNSIKGHGMSVRCIMN